MSEERAPYHTAARPAPETVELRLSGDPVAVAALAVWLREYLDLQAEYDRPSRKKPGQVLRYFTVKVGESRA
jgi:hypothetical protein